MSLPRTIYLWFLLLVLGFAAPLIMERHSLTVEGTPAAAKAEALSAQDFERFADAERAARSGFADDALLRRPGYRELLGASQKSIEKERQKAWSDARAAYSDLTKTSQAPNVARRILILDHALGKPLDETVVARNLVPALRAAKTPENEIEAELTLWRALYGGHKAFPTSSSLAAEVGRVQRMRLRFMENRVLADLYHAYGDTARAQAARRAFDDAALADRTRQLAFSVAALLSLVIGLGLLLYFAVHAYERRH
jgi:hypothetical protein